MIVEKEEKLIEKVQGGIPKSDLQAQIMIRSLPEELSFIINHVLVGSEAGSGTNYGEFFVAPFPCSLIRVFHRHGGGSTAACGVMIQKIPNGTSSPIDMLDTAINLNGSGATAQNIEATKTEYKRLDVGDSVQLAIDSGDPADAVDAVFTLVLKVQMKYLPI